MDETRPRQYAAAIIREAKRAHQQAGREPDEAARQALLEASKATRQRMLAAVPEHLRGIVQEHVHDAWERGPHVTRR